jgi:hypothetical protein
MNGSAKGDTHAGAYTRCLGAVAAASAPRESDLKYLLPVRDHILQDAKITGSHYP